VGNVLPGRIGERDRALDVEGSEDLVGAAGRAVALGGRTVAQDRADG
jgi:hypothetical protein